MVLEKRPEVVAAYLFGSSVFGRTHPQSDVDIALFVEEKAYQKLDKAEPYGYKARMMVELMEALGTDRVGLVLLHGAPPLLAHEVIARGKLLFSQDEKARLSFEVATKHRYMDTKPLREIKHYHLYERTKRGEFSKLSPT